MTQALKVGVSVVLALLYAGGDLAMSQEREHAGGERPEARPTARAPAHPVEPHPGPTHYQRVTEPKGWDARPATVDRSTYQHNFQAARTFRIGPYRGPRGYSPRHWGYGAILPRAYWAPQFVLGDYWLFALETPPVGYEWVRVGNDALLVSLDTGEVLQAEYGVFG